MSAREMFEELGYKLINTRVQNHICWYKFEDDFHTYLEFDNEILNAYERSKGSFYLPIVIDNKLNKAIQKQIEELGW